MSETDVFLRLFAATLAGGVLGLNRDLHGKPAGVRTFALVSLAAASITISSSIGAPDPTSLSRVVQGLVTGIGFIGAGIILHEPGKNRVHGLTTAAATWFSVAIGLMCALGLWSILLTAGGLCFLVLMFGGDLELWTRQWFASKVTKSVDAEAPDMEP